MRVVSQPSLSWSLTSLSPSPAQRPYWTLGSSSDFSCLLKTSVLVVKGERVCVQMEVEIMALAWIGRVLANLG